MMAPQIPPLSQTLVELDRLDGKADGRYGNLGSQPGIDLSPLNTCAVLEGMPKPSGHEGHEHQRSLIIITPGGETSSFDCNAMAQKLALLNGFVKKSSVPQMTVKMLSGQRLQPAELVTPEKFLAFTLADTIIGKLLAAPNASLATPSQLFESVNIETIRSDVQMYAGIAGYDGARYQNLDIHGAFAVFKAEFGEEANVFRPDPSSH